MDKDNMLKGLCKLQLQSITSVDDDPTLQKLTFSIVDFEASGNRQIITKELAESYAPTLKGKPLLCVYSENTDSEQPNDHFNGHGECVQIDRYGNEYLGSNSIAIGSALDGGYFGNIQDENGNEIEVLLCDFYIWIDRNIPIVQLINEIHDNNLPLFSSCEYWYSNYSVNNGTTTIEPPLIFSGHAILGSGENNSKIIEPAYKSSKLLSINERWSKAISQLINSKNEDIKINNNNEKEESSVAENMFYKSLCELSFGDIREKIMTALSKTMTVDEFYNVYVSNYGVYDSYFIYESYIGDKYVNYKVPYTKTDSEVTVDLSNKVEVKREDVWVEVSTMEQSVNELNEKINDITNQLNIANETITTITTEKENIERQFNEATDKITSLNSKVEEMSPIIEQHNAEIIEKALNEKKEYYEAKFKAVNGLEKFESEEVQELIKKSINNDDEGKNAILSINTILVDMVQIKTEEKPVIKEISSKSDNLLPTSNDFDSRYGF